VKSIRIRFAPLISLSPVGSLVRPSPISPTPPFFSNSVADVVNALLVNPAAVIVIPPAVKLWLVPAISTDSVALCLEQTFCDGYHSAIQSLLTFELSTNWARQTEKRDGAIRNFGQSSVRVACAPMRRWLDNLSTRTRVLLTIAVVAVAVVIIACS
jgi:hypothetical protein